MYLPIALAHPLPLLLQLNNGSYRPIELPGNTALRDFAVVLSKDGHPLPLDAVFLEVPKSSM
jgi:hypothetical protein